MKRKTISKAVKEQSKYRSDVWRAVQNAATTMYGCLLPEGRITVPVVLSWTKEEMLGVLKRSGKIISWAWINREYEDGNKREYSVVVDTAKL